MGAAIPRALQAWLNIELIDDREGSQFKAMIGRPPIEQVTGEVTGQVTGQVLRLLSVIKAEHSRGDLQTRLQLKHRDSFIIAYL